VGGEEEESSYSWPSQAVLTSSPFQDSWPDVSSLDPCVFSCLGASSRQGWRVCPVMGHSLYACYVDIAIYIVLYKIFLIVLNYYLYICVCMCVCMYVYVCMHVCMYVCVCIFTSQAKPPSLSVLCFRCWVSLTHSDRIQICIHLLTSSAW
jgi:nuclear pore complex protein Nup62